VFIMAGAWLGNSLYRGHAEAPAWKVGRSFPRPLETNRSANV